MPRSRTLTAVPFVGKDVPSAASEFAHPDVVIGLTIMAFRYEGALAVALLWRGYQMAWVGLAERG